MFKKSSLLVAISFAIAASSFAVHSSASASGTQQHSATAVSGYDLVSFFGSNSSPQIGSAQFSVVHQGKQYRFVSQANADAFEANPSAFLPQFAGHCAWAAAEGYIAPGDPKFATVVNGKLYLNYNADVQATWSKDIPGFIAKAERNWPGIAPASN